MRRKGSISIFLALILLSVLTLILVIEESVRYEGLERVMEQAGDAAIDSMFASYSRNLLDRYGLLFYDGGRGKGLLSFEDIENQFSRYFNENAGGGSILTGGSLYRLSVSEARVDKVITATDYQGEMFIRSALQFYVFDAPERLLSQIRSDMNLLGEGEAAKANADEAQRKQQTTDWNQYGMAPEKTEGLMYVKVFMDPEKEKESGMVIPSKPIPPVPSTSPETPQLPIESEKDPFDQAHYEKEINNSAIGVAEEVKKKGWLSLALPKETAISGYRIRTADFPSKTAVDEREPEGGSILTDAIKKVTFDAYLTDYFSSFTTEGEREGIQYELEYILNGKSTDYENFKAAADRLLWIRTGMNALHIMGDAGKRDGTKAAAEVAMGWTGIPALVALTQVSLEGAWAYAEAVADMKILLGGGKVPIRKDEESWMLDLGSVVPFLRGTITADKRNENGLSYDEYLRMFLFMADFQETAYRTMDIVQHNLRKKEPNFLMSSQVCALQISVDGRSRPLFAALPLVRRNLFSYRSEYKIESVFASGY